MFNTVLLSRTIDSSCSLTNAPSSGPSPVFTTMPSLTHCQNCVCVVQNSFRFRHTTSAVFFFFFFLVLSFLFDGMAFELTSVFRWRQAISGLEAATEISGIGDAYSIHDLLDTEKLCLQ